MDEKFGSQNCSVLGQVLFDPLGYVGGVGLGTGQGNNTKVGLVVIKDGNVNMLGRIIDPIMISEVNYKETTDLDTKVKSKTVSGQGSIILWNKMNGGAARTELIIYIFL